MKVSPIPRLLLPSAATARGLLPILECKRTAAGELLLPLLLQHEVLTCHSYLELVGVGNIQARGSAIGMICRREAHATSSKMLQGSYTLRERNKGEGAKYMHLSPHNIDLIFDGSCPSSIQLLITCHLLAEGYQDSMAAIAIMTLN